ncbi:MAG: hypothetical protein IKI56_04415 [Ruminococcus sp.]|nr:hypothetical protein [Ruminococcus sp.]
MKRFTIILTCGLLLSGCSDNSNSSDNSSAIEIETAEETAAAATAAVTEKVTAASETELPGAEDTDIGKAVVYWTDEGVSVGMSLKKDYYLSKVIPAEHDEFTPLPVAADFDFDGYDEVFVLSAPYMCGTYYRLNLGKSGFESWDAMNELTASQIVELDKGGEEMFHFMEYYDRKARYKYYKWDGKNPVPVKEDVSYSRDYYYTDHYEYIDGEKKLVSREYGDADTLVKTDDTPVYFRVNENSIDVFREDKIIQNIPDIGLHELTEKWNEHMGMEHSDWPVYAPEEFIYESDYDSDGCNDFCIPVDLRYAGGEDRYIYFWFDPDKGEYVPWEELNKVCKKLIMYRDRDVLEVEDVTAGIDTYKWENGELVFVEHSNSVRIHD